MNIMQTLTIQITTIIPGGRLVLPAPLPAKKSPPKASLPLPGPATIGQWQEEPSQDKELHPKIGTLASTCSRGHYYRVENAGDNTVKSKYHRLQKTLFTILFSKVTQGKGSTSQTRRVSPGLNLPSSSWNSCSSHNLVLTKI